MPVRRLTVRARVKLYSMRIYLLLHKTRRSCSRLFISTAMGEFFIIRFACSLFPSAAPALFCARLRDPAKGCARHDVAHCIRIDAHVLAAYATQPGVALGLLQCVLLSDTALQTCMAAPASNCLPSFFFSPC